MRTLTKLFNHLETKLKNTTLFNLFGSINYKGDDWKNHINFSDFNYQRKLVHQGEQVEILILSWKKGQKTKIHDHSENGCVLSVLQGKLKEQRYCNETLNTMHKTEVSIGNYNYIDNSRYYHDIEALEDSVSLHIYSPPKHIVKFFTH